jgi:hypothetical protein
VSRQVELELDDASLRASLAECIAYCGDRGQHAPAPGDFPWILRSEELRDVALACLPPLYHPDAERGASSERDRPMRDAFAEFADARRRLLGREIAPSAATAMELERRHALLAVDWKFHVFEGGGWDETNGYLDFSELPPWDTWLVLADNTWRSETDLLIVSWVPRWAETLVNEGLRVQVFGNGSWLERRSDRFVAVRWTKPE